MSWTTYASAILSLTAGVVLTRWIVSSWYARAVARGMRRTARSVASSGEGEIIDALPVEVAARAPVSARALRRLRATTAGARLAGLLAAAFAQAMITLVWIEPPPEGHPAVTLPALAVTIAILLIVPAALLFRSFVGPGQVSPLGGWWLFTLAPGLVIGSAAWGSISSVADGVRIVTAAVTFVVLVGVAFLAFLAVSAGLRALRAGLSVSGDGFAFLSIAIGAAGFEAVLQRLGTGRAAAWSLLLVSAPIILLAVLVPGMTRRAAAAPAPLLFLRAFGHASTSNKLLRGLARTWLYLGEIHLISGEDLAKTTVTPDAILAFFTLRLRTYFVSSRGALERRLRSLAQRPGRDGRYDVREFPCFADTWKQALSALVPRAAAVLMDLRRFTRDNAGCLHELRTLAATGAVAKSLFVVDASTDVEAIRTALTGGAPPGQPGAPRLLSWTGSSRKDLRATMDALLDIVSAGGSTFSA